MAIREIQAKQLLAHIARPDSMFGTKYNMNIYRGCQHQCIYCDSRSECYQIEDFRDVLVKVNAVELLKRELPRKRKVGLIGTGAMSDPYGPVEKTYNLTGRALQVIARLGFPIHLLTKSDMVLRDLETLVAINQVRAVVSFTITTADDELGLKLEPGAPPVSRRYAAMATLAARGVQTGVMMMPILPFIEDTVENIIAIVTRAHDCGARHVVPWFGMTMRDRQRAYFYDRLDELFPGMRQRYEQAYGERYEATSPHARELGEAFEELRQRLGLDTGVRPYEPSATAQQLAMF
jgi:DNA repair photolyase